MRRTLLGIAVLLHGLAHANAGMLAADDGSVVATMLWATASIGFVTAGLGLVGVRRLSGVWPAFGMTAAGCSVLMLAIYRPATAAVGLVVDLVLKLALSRPMSHVLASSIDLTAAKDNRTFEAPLGLHLD